MKENYQGNILMKTETEIEKFSKWIMIYWITDTERFHYHYL